MSSVVTGVIAEAVISSKIVAANDAAATAANIFTHQMLFQLGLTLYLLEMACTVIMALLFYELLKPVNRVAALVAAGFGLTGAAVKTVARIFYGAPLVLLGGDHYLTALDADQLQALALAALHVNNQAAGMSLFFSGAGTIIQGYLILRSTFLPRALGVLAMVGGLGWLTFAYQPLGSQAFLYVSVVGILGALATIVWLLAFGVNQQRWQERAAAGY